MRDAMQWHIFDVQSVTVRSVAGHGDQAEVIIQTKRGALGIRLIPKRDTVIRFTDLRKRDKRKRAKPLAFGFDVAGDRKEKT